MFSLLIGARRLPIIPVGTLRRAGRSGVSTALATSAPAPAPKSKPRVPVTKKAATQDRRTAGKKVRTTSLLPVQKVVVRRQPSPRGASPRPPAVRVVRAGNYDPPQFGYGEGDITLNRLTFTEETAKKVVVVEALIRQTRRLAIVSAWDEDWRGWKVHVASGQMYTVSPKDLRYQLPTRNPPFILRELGTIESTVKDLVERARPKVKELWEHHKGSDAILMPADLVEFLFPHRGGKPVTPIERYAVYHLLMDHPQYFRSARATTGFLVQSAETMADITAQRTLLNLDSAVKTPEMAERFRQHFAFLARVTQRLKETGGDVKHKERSELLHQRMLRIRPDYHMKQTKPNAISEKYKEFDASKLSEADLKWDPTGVDVHRIGALTRFALTQQGADLPDVLVMKGIMVPLDRSRVNRPIEAIELLNDLGLFKGDENLIFQSSPLPRVFSEDVQRAASELELTPDTDYDAKLRRQFDRLALAVDSASTTEVDDAISIDAPDAHGDSWVYVHIADPTRLMRPRDMLDTVARRRISTVYMPEAKIPMLPSSLGAGIMSLREGHVSYGLTVAAKLSATGEVLNSSIFPTRLTRVKRLTYEAVNAILDGTGSAVDEETTQLVKRTMAVADARTTRRQRLGAVSIYLPRPQVQLQQGQVHVTIEGLMSRSSTMVAECMILCGEIFAATAAEYKLPIPFRVQFAPEIPADFRNNVLSKLPPIVRDYAILPYMTPALTMGVPGRHYSLGLDAYVHASSPIRRYTDIITHFQMKALLGGDKPPFTSPDEIMRHLAMQAPTAREIRWTQRASERFWVLRYLEAQAKDRLYKGMVLEHSLTRNDVVSSHVVLLDIGVRTYITFRKPPAIGQEVLLRLETANAQANVIVFEEPPPSPAA